MASDQGSKRGSTSPCSAVLNGPGPIATRSRIGVRPPKADPMTVAPYLASAAPAATADRLRVAMRSGRTWLVLPFDALRAQYAGAVQAGFIERSLLASARFERALAGLEQWMLGPLARRI